MLIDMNVIPDLQKLVLETEIQFQTFNAIHDVHFISLAMFFIFFILTQFHLTSFCNLNYFSKSKINKFKKTILVQFNIINIAIDLIVKQQFNFFTM